MSYIYNIFIFPSFSSLPLKWAEIGRGICDVQEISLTPLMWRCVLVQLAAYKGCGPLKPQPQK